MENKINRAFENKILDFQFYFDLPAGERLFLGRTWFENVRYLKMKIFPRQGDFIPATPFSCIIPAMLLYNSSGLCVGHLLFLWNAVTLGALSEVHEKGSRKLDRRTV